MLRACPSNGRPICQGNDRCTFASVPTANFWPGWITISRSAFGTWRNAREIPFPGPPLDSGWHNLAFYPDSDHLTFSTARGMVETWDTRTARRVSSFAGRGSDRCQPGRQMADETQTLDPVELPNGIARVLAPAGKRPDLVPGLEPGRRARWPLARPTAGWRYGTCPRSRPNSPGSVWRGVRMPGRQQQQEPQPFVPATPAERNHQVTQYTNLGHRLASVGRLAEAEQAYRRRWRPAEKLVDGNSAASDFRDNLETPTTSSASVLSRIGKPAEAEAEFRKALAIIQKLADDNPTAPVYRANLSIVLHNLAAAARSLGRAAEARDGYDRAIVLAERLVQESPTNTTYRSHPGSEPAPPRSGPQRPGRRPRGSGRCAARAGPVRRAAFAVGRALVRDGLLPCGALRPIGARRRGRIGRRGGAARPQGRSGP